MTGARHALIRFKGTPLVWAAAVLLAGCGSSNGTSGNGTPSQAATPAFSVSAGAYTTAQSVAITDATAGATIYYTTNGTAPTTSSGTYSAPISITATTTIEAMAVASNFTNSSVASASYTIASPQAAAPAFSVSAGTYTTLQSVAITDATAGATIYYTTDGTTPTTSSTAYSVPVPIAVTTTLEALAVDTDYANSNVTSATYSINLPAAPTIAQITDIHQGFIYEIVTDRFVDGDATNDNPSESPGLYDSNGFTDPAAADWNLYWGGDLAGIQQKLNYLKSMGAAGIWISPPMNNIRVNAGANNGETGYHGYWPRDWMQIDEHFGDDTNGWTAFDDLITAAHADGIRVYVDFPANDSNPIGAGEDGSLYNNGTLVTTYSTDTSATPYYHHNPNISNYDDRYQVQYDTLESLADLDQTNPWVDSYLKTAVEQFLSHGVDGFRFDAALETNWGWEYSLENTIANWNGASSPSRMAGQPFIFGEWEDTSTDALYPDSVKFSNNSGMNLLDYPLYWQLADVFGTGGSFNDIDNELTLEDAGSSSSSAQPFTQPNDLVTFFDNHDNPRILSMGADQMAVKQALSFLLTCRGLPVLYYADEQYLFSDTNGGATPYERNGMTSFNSTDAVLLIQYLASLRASNPALAYGTMKQRWINDDVYIYERQLGTNVILVAINKNPSTDQAITGLDTDLPPGSYTDYLAQTMGGVGIAVTGTAGSNNAVTNFTLPHRGVSIWVSTGAVPPSIGSVTPRVANPGAPVTISGASFGATAGTVNFSVGSTTLPATVSNWSNGQITAVVPALAAGAATVTVTQGTTSNAAPFTVNTSTLIPVNFSVSGTPTLASTDVIMISGSVAELGNWATTFNGAIGPVTIPSTGNGLLTISVPAGAALQFKFMVLHSDGTFTYESGANHTYTVPATGIGTAAVTWQN
jgi:glycosidase